VVPLSDRLSADRGPSGAGNAGSGGEAGGTGKGLGSGFLPAVDVSWAPVPGGGEATRAVRGAFRSNRLGSSWRTAACGAGGRDAADPIGRPDVRPRSARLGTACDTLTAGAGASGRKRVGLVGDAGAFRVAVLGGAAGVGRAVRTASRPDRRGLSCGWSALGAATICAPGLAGPTEGFTAGTAGEEASLGGASPGLLARRGRGDSSGGRVGRGTSTGLASGMGGRGLTLLCGRGRSGNTSLVEAGAFGVASARAGS
jgi:hypothetical protein